MDRNEAIARARKLYGKSGAVQENPRALTAEQKEAVRAELAPLIEERKRLQGELAELRKKIDPLQSKLYANRRAVGYVDEVIKGFPLFHVCGTGDNWAECFRVIDAAREKERAEREARKAAANDPAKAVQSWTLLPILQSRSAISYRPKRR